MPRKTTPPMPAFARTYAQRVREAALSKGAKALLFALVLFHADDQGQAPVGFDELARETGASRRSIIRHAKEVEAQGWASRTKGGGRGRPSCYLLTPPEELPNGATDDTVSPPSKKATRKATPKATKATKPRQARAAQPPAQGLAWDAMQEELLRLEAQAALDWAEDLDQDPEERSEDAEEGSEDADLCAPAFAPSTTPQAEPQVDLDGDPQDLCGEGVVRREDVLVWMAGGGWLGVGCKEVAGLQNSDSRVTVCASRARAYNILSISCSCFFVFCGGGTPASDAASFPRALLGVGGSEACAPIPPTPSACGGTMAQDAADAAHATQALGTSSPDSDLGDARARVPVSPREDASPCEDAGEGARKGGLDNDCEGDQGDNDFDADDDLDDDEDEFLCERFVPSAREPHKSVGQVRLEQAIAKAEAMGLLDDPLPVVVPQTLEEVVTKRRAALARWEAEQEQARQERERAWMALGESNPQVSAAWRKLFGGHFDLGERKHQMPPMLARVLEDQWRTTLAAMCETWGREGAVGSLAALAQVKLKQVRGRELEVRRWTYPECLHLCQGKSFDEAIAAGQQELAAHFARQEQELELAVQRERAELARQSAAERERDPEGWERRRQETLAFVAETLALAQNPKVEMAPPDVDVEALQRMVDEERIAIRKRKANADMLRLIEQDPRLGVGVDLDALRRAAALPS